MSLCICCVEKWKRVVMSYTFPLCETAVLDGAIVVPCGEIHLLLLKIPSP